MPFLKVPRWFYCLPVLFAFVSCSTAPRTVKKRNSVPLLPGMTANDDKEAEYADEVPEVAELPVIERFDEPTTPENPEEDEDRRFDPGGKQTDDGQQTQPGRQPGFRLSPLRIGTSPTSGLFPAAGCLWRRRVERVWRCPLGGRWWIWWIV